MKKLRVILLALVLVLTTMIPASVVNADSPVEVSGEYEITLTNAECVNAYYCNSIYVICLSYASTYEGDLAGTAEECFNFYFCVNSETSIRVGMQTFSGTVLGKEGTYSAYVRHQSLANGGLKMEQTIISGTDELADIQDTLVFTVTQTDLGVWEGTYSGNVSFAQ